MALLFILIPLYFIPSFVAGIRDHKQTASIFLLNLLLGWTFIGWAIAIIWAASDNVEPKKVIEEETPKESKKSKKKS